MSAALVGNKAVDIHHLKYKLQQFLDFYSCCYMLMLYSHEPKMPTLNGHPLYWNRMQFQHVLLVTILGIGSWSDLGCFNRYTGVMIASLRKVFHIHSTVLCMIITYVWTILSELVLLFPQNPGMASEPNTTLGNMRTRNNHVSAASQRPHTALRNPVWKLQSGEHVLHNALSRSKERAAAQSARIAQGFSLREQRQLESDISAIRALKWKWQGVYKRRDASML